MKKCLMGRGIWVGATSMRFCFAIDGEGLSVLLVKLTHRPICVKLSLVPKMKCSSLNCFQELPPWWDAERSGHYCHSTPGFTRIKSEWPGHATGICKGLFQWKSLTTVLWGRCYDPHSIRCYDHIPLREVLSSLFYQQAPWWLERKHLPEVLQ